MVRGLVRTAAAQLKTKPKGHGKTETGVMQQQVKECLRPLEASRDKDSPLDPLEGVQSCQYICYICIYNLFILYIYIWILPLKSEDDFSPST